MVFRGVLQDVLAANTSTWVGVLLASVLFGMMHPMTLAYAVLATIMGVYLGWLYLATGDLLTPILTHAAYDFVVLVWLVRGSGAVEMTEEEEEEEEEPDDEDDSW